MDILTIIVMAVCGEAVWETLKMVWQTGKFNWDRIGAIAVCLILAFGARLDIFELVGIPLVTPYVGTALTGILASRGANFIHDLYSKIEK